MHRSPRRPAHPGAMRRWLAVPAGAILCVAGALGVAPPASASSAPAVGLATPQVDGTSATVAFTVNRGPKAIADAVCSLTDAADVVTEVACGAPVAGLVRKSTDYATTLTDLAAGDQVFSVVVTLTDGGTATGRTAFTVPQPAPVAFATSAATCAALPGGAFVADTSWWQIWSCDFDAATADAGAAASAALGPLCLADGGVGYGGGLVAPGRYEISCWLT